MKILEIDLDKLPRNEKESEMVAKGLSKGLPVMMTPSNSLDTIDPSKGEVVPIGWMTDGVYLWPMSYKYYVLNYNISLPDEIRNYFLRNVNKAELTEKEAKEASKEAMKIFKSISSKGTMTKPPENSRPFEGKWAS